MVYNLDILDKFGNVHRLRVFGIDKITGAIAEVDLRPIVERFKTIKMEDIARPYGEVDVLIEYDYAGWHPIPELADQHLVVLTNIFGKCVGGRCPSVTKSTDKIVSTASFINSVKLDGILEQFDTIEYLGVQCDPKCGTCPIGGKPYSLKEERELKMIENNLEFKYSYWITGYPWLKDPKMLPDN